MKLDRKQSSIVGGAIVVGLIGLLCLEPVRSVLGSFLAVAVWAATIAAVCYLAYMLLMRQVAWGYANPELMAQRYAPLTAHEKAQNARKVAVGFGILAVVLRAFGRVTKAASGGPTVQGSDHWGMRG